MNCSHHKYFLSLLVFFIFLLPNPVPAQNENRIAENRTSPVDSKFDVSLGHRVGELDWNIASDLSGTATPNILSELSWEELKIFQVEANNRTVFWKVFVVKSSVAYGWIYDGENQDSDYLGDNRTYEFSRSNNRNDEGNVLDVSGGLGIQLSFGSGFFSFVPLVGYSYNEQNLNMTDGFQTITWVPGGPSLGPFAGLDSTYETEWKGPWAGFDLIFRSMDKQSIFTEIELLIGFEYHWANYEAVADWNLRSDLQHPKSFEHDADGNGIVIKTKLTVAYNHRWGMNLSLGYQSWWTGAGVDRVFFSDGNISQTQLNEVNWKSYDIACGVTVRF